MPRAVVIFNPIAGSGAGEELSKRAEARLAELGWNVECIATRDANGATPIAQEVAERAERIVVIGGDGSLREAIDGLGERAPRVEVALIPTGNANVVARELEIPLDPDAAIDLLGTGEATPIDVGRANDRLFLAVVGVGWDALTVRQLDRIRHSRFGRRWYRLWADSVYVTAGLIAFVRIGLPRLRLWVDGAFLSQAHRSLHVCNMRTYSKGWAMAPAAHHQSGLFHYQARKRGDLVSFILHLLAAARRRPAPGFVSTYGGGAPLRMEANRPVPVQIDGDDAGDATQLELRILPAAALIVAPARTAPTPPATHSM